MVHHAKAPARVSGVDLPMHAKRSEDMLIGFALPKFVAFSFFADRSFRKSFQIGKRVNRVLGGIGTENSSFEAAGAIRP
jgi:hypothetical protein